MKKIIVVYFTYTGHTKIIAERIKEKLNCDIVEIQPKEAYPDDYQYVVDMSEMMQDKQYIEPEIKPLNADLGCYDIIVLGTPLWWYTMAAPIRTFLKTNDLSGKIIVPFATNAGWLGHTFKDIKELCPNSKVVNELSIKFTEDYTENKLVTLEKKIDDWIEKIKNIM